MLHVTKYFNHGKEFHLTFIILHDIELNNDGPVSTKDETTTTTTEGVSSTGYISTSVVTSPSDSTTIQADANACEVHAVWFVT